MVPKLELPPSLHIPDLLQFRRRATVQHGLDELQKYISFELFDKSWVMPTGSSIRCKITYINQYEQRRSQTRTNEEAD